MRPVLLIAHVISGVKQAVSSTSHLQLHRSICGLSSAHWRYLWADHTDSCAQHRKGNQCICLPEWILIFKHGLSHAIPSWEHKKQLKTDNWSAKKAQINVRQEKKNSSDARQIFYSWSVFVQHISNHVRGLKHRALANKRLSTYNFPTLLSPCSYISYKRKIYWGMFR